MDPKTSAQLSELLTCFRPHTVKEYFCWATRHYQIKEYTKCLEVLAELEEKLDNGTVSLSPGPERIVREALAYNREFVKTGKVPQLASRTSRKRKAQDRATELKGQVDHATQQQNVSGLPTSSLAANEKRDEIPTSAMKTNTDETMERELKSNPEKNFDAVDEALVPELEKVDVTDSSSSTPSPDHNAPPPPTSSTLASFLSPLVNPLLRRFPLSRALGTPPPKKVLSFVTSPLPALSARENATSPQPISNASSLTPLIVSSSLKPIPSPLLLDVHSAFSQGSSFDTASSSFPLATIMETVSEVETSQELHQASEEKSKIECQALVIKKETELDEGTIESASKRTVYKSKWQRPSRRLERDEWTEEIDLDELGATRVA